MIALSVQPVQNGVHRNGHLYTTSLTSCCSWALIISSSDIEITGIELLSQAPLRFHSWSLRVCVCVCERV